MGMPNELFGAALAVTVVMQLAFKMAWNGSSGAAMAQRLANPEEALMTKQERLAALEVQAHARGRELAVLKYGIVDSVLDVQHSGDGGAGAVDSSDRGNNGGISGNKVQTGPEAEAGTAFHTLHPSVDDSALRATKGPVDGWAESPLDPSTLRQVYDPGIERAADEAFGNVLVTWEMDKLKRFQAYKADQAKREAGEARRAREEKKQQVRIAKAQGPKHFQEWKDHMKEKIEHERELVGLAGSLQSPFGSGGSRPWLIA